MRVFIKQEPNKMGGKVSFFVNKRLNRLSDDELLLHACKSNNLSQVSIFTNYQYFYIPIQSPISTGSR